MKSLAIGHEPPKVSGDVAERVLKVFQSNLLSMLSHELRTPLTGILNALTLLEEGPSGNRSLGWSSQELLELARKNAHALDSSLSTVLDLAELESRNLRLQWREFDLHTLIRSVLSTQSGFRHILLKEKLTFAPLIGDPPKLSRAFGRFISRVKTLSAKGKKLEVQSGERRVKIRFALDPKKAEGWKAFRLALKAGHEGGVFSPVSAFSSSFGQLAQMEAAFLSKDEGGIAGEILLSREIIRLHGGKVSTMGGASGSVGIEIILPEHSPRDALTQALRSRLGEAQHHGGGVSLFLLQFQGSPKKTGPGLAKLLEDCVYRSSDSAYSLGKGRFALLLNDWVPAATPELMKRIKNKAKTPFRFVSIHSPEEGFDPVFLVEKALRKL